ncbi:hypothetical protein, containing PKD domain protein [Rhodopirellula maiorica SM1]|uniref:VWFA domain-containing protein n=1 Tax=Rhodopirellula maiorica SM1 TaxID=1265738 RepID=M5RMQ7_9BACT|nr:dockerin type I domain-containing protein [Rhodopirellula maiorica]EMI15249.1 hypothetical protein, containing PKD domain protein [Rhodopirellula maiorica SM1]
MTSRTHQRTLFVERLESRRLLASINANFQVELQTHPVTFGFDHLSILATPTNTQFTDNDGNGFADQECSFALRPDGSYALSIGAGPSLGPLAGTLINGFNRTNDIDPTLHPPANRTTLAPPSSPSTGDAFFHALARLSEGYANNLNYDFFPELTGGFNSNSYISGLLNAAGVAIENPATIFADGDYPGYATPIPQNSLQLSSRKRIDLVFVIDTTGSMEDDIDAAKASASRIINEVASRSLNGRDARIAVVSYQDHPPEGDFAWRTEQGFTCQAATANSGIQSLAVSGGGDLPEALYGALSFAMDSTDLGLWRGGSVEKKIIYITDAPPHSPEPITGLTLSQIIAQANAGGIRISGGEGEDAPTPSTPELPVQIFPVVIGNNATALEVADQIATGTDGKAFRAQGAEDIVDALIAAIDGATGNPVPEPRVLSTSFLSVFGIPADTERPAEIWFQAMDDIELNLVPIAVAGGQHVRLLQESGEEVLSSSYGNLNFEAKKGETYGIQFSAIEEWRAYTLRADLGRGSFRATSKPAAIADATTSTVAARTFDRTDVSRDGETTAVDALMVINRLWSAIGEGETTQTEAGSYDVNGDGSISAIDALMVINAMHKPQNRIGEGEAKHRFNDADELLTNNRYIAYSELDDDERDVILGLPEISLLF